MVNRSKLGLTLLVSMISSVHAQSPAVPESAHGTTASIPDATGRIFTVPAGTKILLALKNEVSTRIAKPGDPVYFVSDFPVVQDGAVVLPAGMYVKGVIDSVQRPGKVKGRAQLQMHFVSMILQNGVEIPLPGSLDQIPSSGGAKVKNSEGTVEQAGTKGKDAQRIASTTLEGTAVGGIIGVGVGNAGMGAGIGSAAGAAVGVLGTLFTRGNDAIIQQGATLEMVLSRPIVLERTQLAGMPASTGIIVPGPTVTQQSPPLAPKPSN